MGQDQTKRRITLSKGFIELLESKGIDPKKDLEITVTTLLADKENSSNEIEPNHTAYKNLTAKINRLENLIRSTQTNRR